MTPVHEVKRKEIRRKRFTINRRQTTILTIIISTIFLLSIVLGGIFIDESRIVTNLNARNLSPSLAHLFGTDWLGRDMFARTIMGLSLYWCWIT